MRNSQQLAAEIVKWQQYLACDPAKARAKYAQEKIAYLEGELKLQREYERKQAQSCRRCGYLLVEGKHGVGACPAGAHGAELYDRP